MWLIGQSSSQKWRSAGSLCQPRGWILFFNSFIGAVSPCVRFTTILHLLPLQQDTGQAFLWNLWVPSSCHCFLCTVVLLPNKVYSCTWSKQSFPSFIVSTWAHKFLHHLLECAHSFWPHRSSIRFTLAKVKFFQRALVCMENLALMLIEKKIESLMCRATFVCKRFLCFI